MKKQISLILAIALLLTLLSGCSGKTQTAETTAAAGTTAAAETTAAADTTAGTTAAAASGEKVTLKFTGWRTEDQDAINKMNEKFTAENPNIEVVYEPVAATEYDTYLQTALANGTAADLIMMRSFSGGKTVYSGGKITTLTTDSVPNLKNYPDSAVSAWASDGKSFAVPIGMTVEGVHYNKDIFDKCGITKTPDTVKELLDDCKLIKDKGYLPIAGGVAEPWYVSEEITSSILMATIGSSQWVKDLYAKKLDFTDAKYVQMLQTLQDLEQYYPEFYDGVGYEDCQQLFVTGQAAMYMSGSFELTYLTTTNPDLKLGCFAFPGQDAAPTAVNFTAAVGVGGYSGTKYPEQVLTYLNWLASDEGGGAYANGVLGFFSPNPTAPAPESEIAQQWSALRDGREAIHLMGYETMTESAPDYSTAIGDTALKMVTEKWTAAQAADYMQQQMSWFFK